MWLCITDEDGPLFYNLDVRQDIRFVSVRHLETTLLPSRPHLAGLNFGDPDDLLLVLIGPGHADFEIVLSLPPGPDQEKNMTLVQTALRHGLENGKRLLDLDKLLEKAREGFQHRN